MAESQGREPGAKTRICTQSVPPFEEAGKVDYNCAAQIATE